MLRMRGGVTPFLHTSLHRDACRLLYCRYGDWVKQHVLGRKYGRQGEKQNIIRDFGQKSKRKGITLDVLA